MSLAIGVDVGGTKIAAGVVDAAGRIVARLRRPTSVADAAALRGQVVAVAGELAAAHPATAVGVGVAGWIDAHRAVVRYGPHLPWRDEPVRVEVTQALGLPVVVENDANVAAWAEYRFGVGAEVGPGGTMVMLTVGTGVGGGIVLGGRLHRGAHGIAGELGHVRVVPDGRPCPCGRRGCLERYASGTALVNAARAGARAAPEAAADLLRRAGGDPAAVTGAMVSAAAAAGDAVACAAFAEIGHWLGVACAELTQVLDPDMFVVGGGVADAADLLLPPAHAAFAAQLGRRGDYPTAPIRVAERGNDAG
ncbi:MAG TPA: ROK family protein, partial [Pilimelia sp.]|nr:ROK family protein [Pilimelia sp.]